MALMLKTPGGGLTQNNLAATPSSTTPGTTVTAHATINTKGSWVELISSTNFDTVGVTLVIANDTTAGVAVSNLYDLGVGAAASEVVIAANIPNTTGTLALATVKSSLFLPISIPKGSRISCRKQSNVTVNPGSVAIFLHGGYSVTPWRAFAGVDAIGVDTADSGGTAHTPGNSGSESTWANIGSTLTRQYFAFQPLVMNGSDATMTALVGHVETGIASVTLGERLFVISASEATGNIYPTIPLYGNFPTGTQMMIRAEMSGTADTDYDFALLGFY